MSEALRLYAKTRDNQHFNNFYREHLSTVRGFLSQLCGPELADEITQQTFIRIMRKPDSYDPEQPIEPWLIQVARNVFRNHMRHESRKCRKHTSFTNMLDDEKDYDPPAAPSEHIDAETAEQVRALLDILPAKQRRAVKAIYFDGLKYHEAAKHLRMKPSTFNGCFVRAMRALRARRGRAA